MPPVIDSLLGTDPCKFTMRQAMLHRHPQTEAQCTFVCRNAPERPLAGLEGAVNAGLDHLCGLRMRPDELAYLRGLSTLPGST